MADVTFTRPDLDTFAILPWRPQYGKVARLICDVHNPDGTPFVGDPRNVLKRVLRRAEELGLSFNVGPELEFFLFANSSQPQILDRGGYFDAPPRDLANDVRRDINFALESMGVAVEYSHHEVAPSQHEIDLRYQEGLVMADYAQTYRVVVKEVARKHGCYATFMPKPLFGENGSGMHCHQSIWDSGKPLFYDENGYAGLSDMARYYIGGLLKHAPALLAFTNPSVNSFHRLVPGFEAPVNLVYSQRNRSACIRIPITGSNPKAKRIEFRCPDPSSNPYLAFAAMLLAGIDGIQNRIEPLAPIDKDLYELPPDEHAEVPTVPGSLGAVLDALEADHEFLLAGDVFTPDLIETWIELKRAEIQAIAMRPHPHEFELYYAL